MQFADGDLPLLVKERDLQPEISYDEAHAQVASIVQLFVNQQLGLAVDQQELQKVKSATESLLRPIVQAYLFEGSKHFKSLSQIGGQDESSTCVRGLCKDGSPYASTGYNVIANDPRINLAGMNSTNK